MTDNLRELTKKEHQNAERQKFVSRLLKKEVSKEEYAIFLYNQLQCYFYLELFATECGIFENFENMKRSDKIYTDFFEIWNELGNVSAPKTLNATKEYVSHIFEIQDNEKALLAHVYTRHFGDLSGGQILRNVVPGSATVYDFSEDSEKLKERFRVKLSNDLDKESRICFNYVTQLFQEMENVYTLECT